ncbi:MAG: OmpA family protein [Acidimicrobiia bacterium]|nr:OmpA family protein [Acidimicrobiia bacterium]
MADDSGSPDYYPLRWKVADAAEDLFVLHRGKLAAFVVLLIAGIAVGLILFTGDDDTDVTTGSTSPSSTADGNTAPTTEPVAPDDSTGPSTEGPADEDGSSVVPETTEPPTSTEPPDSTESPSTTSTTTTTEPPVSPRAPADDAELNATVPGAVIRLSLDAVVLSGGLPSDNLADEAIAIAQATFPDSEIVDDFVVDPSFPAPDELVFRVAGAPGAEVFEYNRNSINPPYRPLVDRLAAWLIAQPERTVEVAGHTDDEGPAPGNQRLSQRRADDAAAYLIQQGVEASRVTAVGYGEDDPIESNATDAGKLANRRVEFIIGS